MSNFGLTSPGGARAVPRLRRLALAAALLASTAGPALSQELQPLRVVTSFEVQSLDPIEEGYWMPEYGVAEMLLQFQADGTIHPWLAQSFERTDDRTWVFDLRPGVTFQDGRPMDAAAVLAVIDRNMALSAAVQGSVPAGTTFDITGPLQITVRTPQPFPALASAFASEDDFPIYDVDAVEAVHGDWDKLAGAGIYTGPYAIAALTPEELTLQRYDGYWAGEPALPGVVISFVSDPSARILAVENGEADIALYPPLAARTMVEAAGLHFNTGTPGTGGFVFYMNVRTAPFDDAQVRRAIDRGINFAQIANDVFHGDLGQATGFYAPIFPWRIENQSTDVAAAGQLLDEAGWLRQGDGIRMKDGHPLAFSVLIYPQQPDLGPLTNAIQAQLRAIGVDMQIRVVEDIYAGFQDRSITWGAGISADATVNGGGMPDTYLAEHVVTGADENWGGYSNAEVDSLVAELLHTVDDARRNEILRRIQDILIDEDPYAFNLTFNRGRAVADDLYRDFQAGFNNYHISWQTAPSR